MLRDGRVLVPTPDAALEGGDELLLVATAEVEGELDAAARRARRRVALPRP